MFFERPKLGTVAIVVQVIAGRVASKDEITDATNEFERLAISANFVIADRVTAVSRTLHAKYFMGSGKAQAVALAVKEHEASLVLVNCSLSGAQERNLEKLFQCRVFDRTALILNIFSQRAQSHEGKLQVELAQLRYASTRLVRSWTHLERQSGSGRTRGGPGEQQIELDRRMLRLRLRQLTEELRTLEAQRSQGVLRRKRVELATIALVGYTNAGKSTLFNRLTDANVYVEDQLFATLDPTVRKLELKEIGTVLLADTVGFIQSLPHELIAAFRATLQVAAEAAVLLHVVDATDRRQIEHCAAVQRVLAQIKADHIPQIVVMNKIDQLESTLAAEWATEPKPGDTATVRVSAAQGVGIDRLLEAIAERLTRINPFFCYELRIPMKWVKLRSLCYEWGSVNDEVQFASGTIWLRMVLAERRWNQLVKQYPDLQECLLLATVYTA